MSNGIKFKLVGGSGGVIIGSAGPLSAVDALRETYGDRLDWHDLLIEFEERAGIAEFDGNMSRAEAEKQAAEHVRSLIEKGW